MDAKQEMLCRARKNITSYVKRHLRNDGDTLMMAQACLHFFETCGHQSIVAYDGETVLFHRDFFLAMEVKMRQFYGRLH